MTTPSDPTSPVQPVNIALRLHHIAQRTPDAVAVVEPAGRDASGKRRYRSVTFRELDEDTDRIARGLRDMGVKPGTRMALLVRPGIDFVSLVFSLMKAGAVAILIDPGMGRGNLIRCLSEAEPEGFVAISLGQAIRTVLRHRFPKARWNLTVGRRWFWRGPTLRQFRARIHQGSQIESTGASDPAAIIFTTGSTGPPKGVLFSHGNFDAQVSQIQGFYGIESGDVDVAAFPLFGLFNGAMGVTTVIADMDPTRPAQVDPANIVEQIEDWKATQTFGSPAVWNRVGQYCEKRKIQLSTVRRVLSAGAPIPAHVLARMKACIHPDGDVHTPYGATEALPVASNCASVVLAETDEKTRQGAGVCVGPHFSGIRWKVIRAVDGPIKKIDDVEELPRGEIGELIVFGPVITSCYVTRTEANATGKIADGDQVWHRMGDVGYLDSEDRFWFCGRMAHRVLTAEGPMYAVPCEAIFNQHETVYRSALVGVGAEGRKRPVLVVEPMPGRAPTTPEGVSTLFDELRQLGQSSEITRRIDDFLIHPSFPVDIRHNAKIFREKLAVWATGQV